MFEMSFGRISCIAQPPGYSKHDMFVVISYYCWQFNWGIGHAKHFQKKGA